MSHGNLRESDIDKYKAPKTLRELISAPKGNLEHRNGQSFMLHVFWEAPNITAAQQLLVGLRQCAAATHRDTPCVPTYFFRICLQDNELCVPSSTVGNHPQIQAAKKKVIRGVPLHAIHAELTKRGIDIALLDADDSTPLSNSQQVHPVAVEFTEVYLDEQAFIEHSGSRDYLDGHGAVMNPALHNRVPQTIRLGSPVESLIEKILEPILKETVRPMVTGTVLWRRPVSMSNGVFISLDFAADGADGSIDITESVVASLPDVFRTESTTCVAFSHPLRENTVRVMFVLPHIPSTETLSALAGVCPLRGEIHVVSSSSSPSNNSTGEMEGMESTLTSLREAVSVAGLSGVLLVNESHFVGYVLHEKASEVVSKRNTAT